MEVEQIIFVLMTSGFVAAGIAALCFGYAAVLRIIVSPQKLKKRIAELTPAPPPPPLDLSGFIRETRAVVPEEDSAVLSRIFSEAAPPKNGWL